MTEHLFVPSSSVFGDARDGAWEFPAPVTLISPAQQQTEDAASISFQLGVPENVETHGAVEWRETEGGFVRLNDPTKSAYLVYNQVTWRPTLSQPSEAWLRFEYRMWSEETERGFDAPALVLFEGTRLVYQEESAAPCEIKLCPWRTRRVYLGTIEPPGELHFFAGEMGDTHKPTGIDLRGMKLEVRSESSQVASAPSSAGSALHLAVPAQEGAKPIFAARPQAVPATTVGGNGQSAAVLGAQDTAQGQAQGSTSLLEKIVFHPVVYVLLWVMSFLIIVVIWRAFEKRRSSSKHFLKKGRK